jgi:hypothetical protein
MPAAPSEAEVIQQAIAKADAETGATPPPAVPPAAPAGGTPAAPLVSDPADPPPPPAAPIDERQARIDSELARREAEVRRNVAALRQAQTQHAATLEKAQKVEQLERDLAALKESAKADPWGHLQKLGVDTMDALARIGGQDDTSKRTPAEIAEIKAELAALKQERATERAEAEKQARLTHEQRVYAQSLGTFHQVLSAKPEEYEAILDRGHAGVARVFEAADAKYRDLIEQGYTPGPPSAADIEFIAKTVEQAYRQEEFAELQQKAQRRRFAGRLTLGDPAATTTAARTTVPAASPSAPTTLTADLNREAPLKREVELTDDERFQQAISIPFPGNKPG